MGNKGKTIKPVNDVAQEKKEKISAEVSRLEKRFKFLTPEQRGLSDGLIKRAAFMRVMLEYLEEDIRENGEFEMFTQSDMVEPYQRKRPAVDIYNQTIKNYQTIMKQLTDLLPKAPPKSEDDGFEGFVNSRERT